MYDSRSDWTNKMRVSCQPKSTDQKTVISKSNLTLRFKHLIQLILSMMSLFNTKLCLLVSFMAIKMHLATVITTRQANSDMNTDEYHACTAPSAFCPDGTTMVFSWSWKELAVTSTLTSTVGGLCFNCFTETVCELKSSNTSPSSNPSGSSGFSWPIFGGVAAGTSAGILAFLGLWSYYGGRSDPKETQPTTNDSLLAQPHSTYGAHGASNSNSNVSH